LREAEAGNTSQGSVEEIKKVLLDLRKEINAYMEHIAKIPHEEVVKARQNQGTLQIVVLLIPKGEKQKREVECYDELISVEDNNNHYDPLPFRLSVAPSRTEGIENKRAEVRFFSYLLIFYS
jgi:hypothetical protein